MTMLSGIQKEVFWNYMDPHSTMIADVQCSLVAVSDGQLEEKRTNSNFFGMLIDESTDISVDKTLVMYLRYVCRDFVATDFIANVRVTHTQQG